MKTNILRFCLLTVAATMLTCLVHGADGNSAKEEAVIKFEHEWADTWVKSDVKAMKKMLTDDFIEVDPSGHISNRSEHLQQFESGKFKVESLKLSNLKVRFFGNVAVVNGIADDKASSAGKDVSGQYGFTDVLVLRGGEWKAASTHATKVAP
jgi:ketosteroid isomerase-like protein